MVGTASGKRNWYLVISGICLFVLGCICWFFPGLTLFSIAVIAGIGFAIAGVMNLVSYFSYRGTPGVTGWMVVYAILDLIIAAMFLIHPIASAFVIPWVIAGFVLAFGVAEIVQCFAVRKSGFPGWGFMLASGILNVLIGIMLFIWPGSAAIFIAAYCIVAGINCICVGAMKN